MFKNYFKIAWRNLLKDRQFTFLNLIGLSTGLACAILIYLWVTDELHIDKFNKNDDRLYQVIKTSPNADGTIATYESTQGLLAGEMAKAYPEIEYAVSVRKEREAGILSIDNKRVKAEWQFAGKNFFHVFSYKIIEGNKNNPLSDKYGVMLSDKLASKLFHTTGGIVGKTIRWEAGEEFSGSYTITGVFEAPPSNASDQFDLLFNYSLYVDKEIGTMGDVSNWGSNSVMTYLLLREGTNTQQFNNKIKDFTKTKIKSIKGAEGLLEWEGDIFIQKYSDKYLYNRYENGVQAGGRIEYVRLFSVIAIFIVVIACINFMNLSTARAYGRLKEVGIKKVVGASRRSLIFQYLGESMLMTFLSLLISIIIVALLLPTFKTITGKELALHFNTNFILSVAGITIVTGFIAGSYPALYLSRFKPVVVLKGRLNTSAGESWVRKGLVIFQFSISVILIISMLVVYRQMKLIQTTNLGYNKDNIIRFSNDGNLKNNLSSFLTEIKNVPGVVNASDADGDFVGHAGHGGGGISWEGKDPNLGIEYYGVGVDYDFIETMGLQMSEGRAFSRDFGSDSLKVIFNEAAIAAMKLKNPIGKTVSLWGQKKEIIGIVKNYHFESLYKKIGPAFLTCEQNRNNILVKMQAGKEKETIAKIEAVYKKYNQGLLFDYRFLDDDYQALYASEQRVAMLSRYFAALAIIISCLGLFGLAAFTAQRRQKEIGIRKVVGASVNNIAVMLSKDFLRLVLIAVLVAFPIAWITMNQWLQGFAYRINIGIDIFVVAGVPMVFITLLTISFQSIKVAIVNPVKSLRTE